MESRRARALAKRKLAEQVAGADKENDNRPVRMDRFTQIVGEMQQNLSLQNKSKRTGMVVKPTCKTPRRQARVVTPKTEVTTTATRARKYRSPTPAPPPSPSSRSPTRKQTETTSTKALKRQTEAQENAVLKNIALAIGNLEAEQHQTINHTINTLPLQNTAPKSNSHKKFNKSDDAYFKALFESMRDLLKDQGMKKNAIAKQFMEAIEGLKNQRQKLNMNSEDNLPPPPVRFLNTISADRHPRQERQETSDYTLYDRTHTFKTRESTFEVSAKSVHILRSQESVQYPDNDSMEQTQPTIDDFTLTECRDNRPKSILKEPKARKAYLPKSILKDTRHSEGYSGDTESYLNSPKGILKRRRNAQCLRDELATNKNIAPRKGILKSPRKIQIINGQLVREQYATSPSGFGTVKEPQESIDIPDYSSSSTKRARVPSSTARCLPTHKRFPKYSPRPSKTTTKQGFERAVTAMQFPSYPRRSLRSTDDDLRETSSEDTDHSDNIYTSESKFITQEFSSNPKIKEAKLIEKVLPAAQQSPTAPSYTAEKQQITIVDELKSNTLEQKVSQCSISSLKSCQMAQEELKTVPKISDTIEGISPRKAFIKDTEGQLDRQLSEDLCCYLKAVAATKLKESMESQLAKNLTLPQKMQQHMLQQVINSLESPRKHAVSKNSATIQSTGEEKRVEFFENALDNNFCLAVENSREDTLPLRWSALEQPTMLDDKEIDAKKSELPKPDVAKTYLFDKNVSKINPDTKQYSGDGHQVVQTDAKPSTVVSEPAELASSIEMEIVEPAAETLIVSDAPKAMPVVENVKIELKAKMVNIAVQVPSHGNVLAPFPQKTSNSSLQCVQSAAHCGGNKNSNTALNETFQERTRSFELPLQIVGSKIELQCGNTKCVLNNYPMSLSGEVLYKLRMESPRTGSRLSIQEALPPYLVDNEHQVNAIENLKEITNTLPLESAEKLCEIVTNQVANDTSSEAALSGADEPFHNDCVANEKNVVETFEKLNENCLPNLENVVLQAFENPSDVVQNLQNSIETAETVEKPGVCLLDINNVKEQIDESFSNTSSKYAANVQSLGLENDETMQILDILDSISNEQNYTEESSGKPYDLYQVPHNSVESFEKPLEGISENQYFSNKPCGSLDNKIFTTTFKKEFCFGKCPEKPFGSFLLKPNEEIYDQHNYAPGANNSTESLAKQTQIETTEKPCTCSFHPQTILETSQDPVDGLTREHNTEVSSTKHMPRRSVPTNSVDTFGMYCNCFPDVPNYEQTLKQSYNCCSLQQNRMQSNGNSQNLGLKPDYYPLANSSYLKMKKSPSGEVNTTKNNANKHFTFLDLKEKSGVETCKCHHNKPSYGQPFLNYSGGFPHTNNNDCIACTTERSYLKASFVHSSGYTKQRTALETCDKHDMKQTFRKRKKSQSQFTQDYADCTIKKPCTCYPQTERLVPQDHNTPPKCLRPKKNKKNAIVNCLNCQKKLKHFKQVCSVEQKNMKILNKQCTCPAVQQNYANAFNEHCTCYQDTAWWNELPSRSPIDPRFVDTNNLHLHSNNLPMETPNKNWGRCFTMPTFGCFKPQNHMETSTKQWQDWKTDQNSVVIAAGIRCEGGYTQLNNGLHVSGESPNAYETKTSMANMNLSLDTKIGDLSTALAKDAHKEEDTQEEFYDIATEPSNISIVSQHADGDNDDTPPKDISIVLKVLMFFWMLILQLGSFFTGQGDIS